MRAKDTMNPKERDDMQRVNNTCKVYEKLLAEGLEPSKAKLETALRTNQSLVTVYNHLRRAAQKEEV